MHEAKYFFSEDCLNFFRPLSGKYREKFRVCIQDLYLRVNGPEANYSFYLGRQDVLEVFNNVLSKIPVIDDPSDTSETIPDDKMASIILASLRGDGWIEEYRDSVSMTTAFRFTPVGRLFAKAFVDNGRAKFRASHRNTRNARNSLSAYLEHGDPHDLVEAYGFAQEVFNDFNESIEEIELMQRQHAESVTEQIVLEKSSDDFFTYLEKRFIPDVSKMLGDDSIKRYESEIKETIHKIKSLENESKADLEMLLRSEYPTLLDLSHGSILIWLLDQIARRIDTACNIKIPELRQALESFTRRSHMVIQQLSRIYSGNTKDLGIVCRRLAALDDAEQREIVGVASDKISLPLLRFVNPNDIRIPKAREKREVNAEISEVIALTPEEILEQKIRGALDLAFSIQDDAIVKNIIAKISELGSIRKKFIPIDSVDDLFSSMHLIALAGNDNNKDFGFEIQELDDMVETPYYKGKDYRVYLRRN